MRGKGALRARSEDSTGITPAYAGKSRHYLPPESESRDHPRVCGEKVDEIGLPLLTLGSPPRMRGKALQLIVLHSTKRITPAYAGKS